MPHHFHPAIIQRAREIWEQSPLFLDTETTGLGDKAEVIEICVIDRLGDRLIDLLVRPRLRIPPDAIRLHGITNDLVREAKSWVQVWPEVEKALNGRTIGIYNAGFDLKMMQQSHRTFGLPWRPPDCFFFDIMKMYSDFAGYSKWQKLEEAARQCGIKLAVGHRAYPDALLARDLFIYMLQKPPLEPGSRLDVGEYGK